MCAPHPPDADLPVAAPVPWNSRDDPRPE